MLEKKEKGFLVALDAGGTMTDTFLIDEEGQFNLGKALTNREDEFKSYLASVADAAGFRGIGIREVHEQAVSIVYTGTSMVNILHNRNGMKVGLLVTRGFEHIAHMERGLTWLALSYEDTMHYALHEHTPPLVDINLVKGVAERIKGPTYYVGCHLPPEAVVVPLSEEDVRKGTEELLDGGVEVIGILFLHSYVDPVHERRAAEIARDNGVVVHTIAIGDPTAVGEQALDEKTLENIAGITGGGYFHANDTEELEAIYDHLDEINPRQVETQSYRPLTDLYYWPLAAVMLLTLFYIMMLEIRLRSVKPGRPLVPQERAG